MPAVEMPGAFSADTLEEDFARKREEMRTVAKDCVLVVDNVPKIGPEKYPKLCAKLAQTFNKFGRLRQDADVEDANGNANAPRLNVVQDGEGRTTGFAFAEFESPEEAHKAMISIHNLQFDRAHRFWACTAGDLERLQEIPENFVPPKSPAVSVANRPNFKSWLMDPRGRDQFMIRHEDTTSIYWHDHVVKPELDYARMTWTEGASVWSPRGTYIATFHPRGIKIWGRVSAEDNDGEVEWVFVMRFEHNNVSLIDFSPCENYLITFNGTEPERDDKRNPRAILVWDVLTGKKKRGFLGPPRSMLGPEGNINWPIFQWSHDDKFFARLNENAISIYQTPDMGLVDKKSVKVPGVQQFAWSPTEPILAYWTPEMTDSPARVTLIELPSKREIRQKALFSVSNIMLHWQQEGKYLACKVDRLTKSKKGQFSNFELFRVKAKDIPIDLLEYKEKDLVQAFGWEPQGNRFAVIHGYSDRPGKADASFFTMDGSQGELKKMFTLENRTVNQIRWSPKGRFVLLAALGSRTGTLEWYDVNDAATKEEPEPIGTNEHFQCNDVQWDPSGRFVTTSVSYWTNMSDNAYAIWTMYGKELCRVSVEHLYEFSWRPRPPSLLSAKQEKDVKKNLKTKRERYEREDKDMKDSVSSGKAARRKEQRDAFYAFQRAAKEHIEREAEKRRQVLAALGNTEDVMETITETVETILSAETTVDKTRKLLTSDDERD